MRNANFYTLVFLLVSALAGRSAHAIQRLSQDIKLPTQAVMEKQSLSPAAAAANNVLNAHAGSTSGSPVEVTSFLLQPDYPRNLSVTPAGTTADVKASQVIVYGKNYFGQSFMETFSISDNQSTATVGSLAFYKIDKIVLPAEEGSYAATWSVGFGSKLGLKNCMDKAGHLVFAVFNGVYEATRPTVAAGASVASSTALLNSSLDGSAVDLFFVQNYRCMP